MNVRTLAFTSLPGAPLSGKLRRVKAIPGTLREGGAPFRSTHWSVVLLAAQSQSLEAARQALAIFCQDYWPALYAFLRRRGHSPSDAQDLTQSFFAHLLEAETLTRASREKGRLRTFLGSVAKFPCDAVERVDDLGADDGFPVQMAALCSRDSPAGSALVPALFAFPA